MCTHLFHFYFFSHWPIFSTLLSDNTYNPPTFPSIHFFFAFFSLSFHSHLKLFFLTHSQSVHLHPSIIDTQTHTLSFTASHFSTNPPSSRNHYLLTSINAYPFLSLISASPSGTLGSLLLHPSTRLVRSLRCSCHVGYFLFRTAHLLSFSQSKLLNLRTAALLR